MAHRSKKLDRNLSSLESDTAARLNNIIRQNDLPRDLRSKLESENKRYFAHVSKLVSEAANG
jgi:hypothetical protein